MGIRSTPPEFLDCLKEVGGSGVVKRFLAEQGGIPVNMRGWQTMSARERQERKVPCPWWWQLPTKRTIDLATAMLAKLLNERLDEMGIDFTIVYNSVIFPNIIDAEARQAACLALNKFRAEIFSGYSKRMTPAPKIPMHTPEEAIAELEHAVRDLGMKVVMFPGFVQRPIPAEADKFPKVFWYDTFGSDSQYDYDPLWAKRVELKVAPTFHQHGYRFGTRTSTSNFVYNSLGNLANP
jgi:predicted TIM-barrel fold metal-dependent hydrolase